MAGKRKTPYGGGPKMKKAKMSTVSKRVTKLEKMIEHKAKEFVVNADNFHVLAGSVQVLNELAPGDNIDEREGRRVMVENFSLRTRISGSAPSIDFIPDYRTAIVWDKFPNQAGAGYGDIFELTTLAQAEQPFAPVNLDNRDRFEILYDNVNGVGSSHTKGFTSVTQGGADQLDVAVYSTDYVFRKVGKQTTYGEGSNIPVTGALLLVGCGAKKTDADNPDIYTKCYNRLRFTDA